MYFYDIDSNYIKYPIAVLKCTINFLKPHAMSYTFKLFFSGPGSIALNKHSSVNIYTDIS